MTAYILRDLHKPDPTLWAAVKVKATADGFPLRGLILALLRAYVEGRIAVDLPRASAHRYCEMCEEWTPQTTCPACGMPTRKQATPHTAEER